MALAFHHAFLIVRPGNFIQIVFIITDGTEEAMCRGDSGVNSRQCGGALAPILCRVRADITVRSGP